MPAYDWLLSNIHVLDWISFAYFNLLWLLKPLYLLSKIISMCVLIELLNRVWSIVWRVSKGTNFFEIKKPTFPEQSSPLANLAYIASTTSYLIIYNTIHMRNLIRTNVLNPNNQKLNIAQLIFSRFKLLILWLFTGLPVRTFRILQMWWASKPRQLALLRPFTCWMCEIVSNKTMLYVEGEFQLNPTKPDIIKDGRTALKIYYDLIRYENLIKTNPNLSLETKINLINYLNRHFWSSPWKAPEDSDREWWQVSRILKQAGCDMPWLFDMKNFNNLQDLSASELQEADRIGNDALIKLNFTPFAQGKIYAFKAKAFGAIYPHPYIVNEIKNKSEDEHCVIGMSHQNPVLSYYKSGTILMPQLWQIFMLSHIFPTKRGGAGTNPVSFIAPVNNQESESKESNLNFSNGKSLEEIQDLGSSTQLSEEQRSRAIAEGVLQPQPFKYGNVMRAVLEYNAQNDLLALKHPNSASSSDKLIFQDSNVQEVYDEHASGLTDSLEKHLGKEAATEWLVAKTTSSLANSELINVKTNTSTDETPHDDV